MIRWAMIMSQQVYFVHSRSWGIAEQWYIVNCNKIWVLYFIVAVFDGNSSCFAKTLYMMERNWHNFWIQHPKKHEIYQTSPMQLIVHFSLWNWTMWCYMCVNMRPDWIHLMLLCLLLQDVWRVPQKGKNKNPNSSGGKTWWRGAGGWRADPLLAFWGSHSLKKLWSSSVNSCYIISFQIRIRKGFYCQTLSRFTTLGNCCGT